MSALGWFLAWDRPTRKTAMADYERLAAAGGVQSPRVYRRGPRSWRVVALAVNIDGLASVREIAPAAHSSETVTLGGERAR